MPLTRKSAKGVRSGVAAHDTAEWKAAEKGYKFSPEDGYITKAMKAFSSPSKYTTKVAGSPISRAAAPFPYFVKFRGTQLMVSLDNTNYFFVKRNAPQNATPFTLMLVNGAKPRAALPEEISLIDRIFPNWRTRGFGKQES